MHRRSSHRRKRTIVTAAAITLGFFGIVGTTTIFVAGQNSHSGIRIGAWQKSFTGASPEVTTEAFKDCAGPPRSISSALASK